MNLSSGKKSKGLKLPIDLNSLPSKEYMEEGGRFANPSQPSETDPDTIVFPPTLHSQDEISMKDVQVLSELGAGNGGSVSKVLHVPSNKIMARKVYYSFFR